MSVLDAVNSEPRIFSSMEAASSSIRCHLSGSTSSSMALLVVYIFRVRLKKYRASAAQSPERKDDKSVNHMLNASQRWGASVLGLELLCFADAA